MVREYDLEDRTTKFAKEVIKICKRIPKNSLNNRIIDQSVGSSGSIGANYREANDSLGKKDFLQKLRISRREAKEAIHWLDLMNEANDDERTQIRELIQEATELKNILSSIIIKSE